jgi:acyl-CoA thioester hydrolase
MGRIQLTRFQKYLDIKILRRPSKLPERSQPALRSGLKGSAVTSRGVGWTGIVKRMLETSITVRWGDMDSYGHVNNVFFVRYLEDTRFALFTPPLGERAPADVPGELSVFDLFPDGSNGLMAGHRIEYRLPLSYEDGPIASRLWITRIGTTSFELGYELGSADRSRVYAIASTALVLVNTESGRPVELPQRLRDTLAQWLGEPVAFRA